jgi:hypothetical protein
MAQVAAVMAQVQGRKALAQGWIELLELQRTGCQLFERFNPALLIRR